VVGGVTALIIIIVIIASFVVLRNRKNTDKNSQPQYQPQEVQVPGDPWSPSQTPPPYDPSILSGPTLVPSVPFQPYVSSSLPRLEWWWADLILVVFRTLGIHRHTRFLLACTRRTRPRLCDQCHMPHPPQTILIDGDPLSPGYILYVAWVGHVQPYYIVAIPRTRRDQLPLCEYLHTCLSPMIWIIATTPTPSLQPWSGVPRVFST